MVGRTVKVSAEQIVCTVLAILGLGLTVTVMVKLPVLIKRLESDLKNYTNYKNNGGVEYVNYFKIGKQAFDIALLLRVAKFMKNFGDICYFEEAIKNQSAARFKNDQGVICIIMPIKLDE